MLAPVTADDPVVSWPPAGRQSASTVLPSVPYRPLRLTATVPCATRRAVETRAAGGEALRTLPADISSIPGEGLATQGVLKVTASGAEVVYELLPAGPCIYRVVADAGGVRVSRDATIVATRTGLLVPQVAELQTDAVTQTRGLAVQLRADARYQSQPTLGKTVLLLVHALALARAGVAVVARRRPGSGPAAPVRGSRGGGPRCR
jgi:arabinosyltransferase C